MSHRCAFYSMLLLFLISITSSPAQKQYDFIFNYGPGKKNSLNTVNGKFTKDMVTNASITISLKLSRKEKRLIYKKIKETGFYGLPEQYEYKIGNNSKIMQINPCSQYELIVFQNNTFQKVNWNNCLSSPTLKDLQFEKLMILSNYIDSIITNKKEYKKLPQPKGAYY